jgi:hypothetical protein
MNSEILIGIASFLAGALITSLWLKTSVVRHDALLNEHERRLNNFEKTLAADISAIYARLNKLFELIKQ